MDNDAIQDMFRSLGPVSIRRMFGGKGIYYDGRILAIEYHDEILLKADKQTEQSFASAGAQRWTYLGKKGQPVAMPYWSIPDAALDDDDELAKWVGLAYEAASRSA
ncbi:TfoX/Sxy family protein [Oryzifoliimicrobium ureilyticus]|uniref:TfoX/Sxy family protein n=1 Tax=Oryzifoliimicrobium ureilyticus TaxID=3113724 RepID=UPI0030763003